MALACVALLSGAGCQADPRLAANGNLSPKVDVGPKVKSSTSGPTQSAGPVAQTGNHDVSIGPVSIGGQEGLASTGIVLMIAAVLFVKHRHASRLLHMARLDCMRGIERPRSSLWKSVRAAHLKYQPRCQFCGTGERPEVHHIRDFADHPELELNDGNLVTLCEGPAECHLRVGHLGNWHTINPDVLLACKLKRVTGTAVTIVNHTTPKGCVA